MAVESWSDLAAFEAWGCLVIRLPMSNEGRAFLSPAGQTDSPPHLDNFVQVGTGLPEGSNQAEQGTGSPKGAELTAPHVAVSPLSQPALKDLSEPATGPRWGAHAAPSGGLGAFSIGAIRGEIESKFANIMELRKGHFRAQIYPSGVVLKSLLGFSPEPPENTQRGAIEGFSAKASRRLREFWMSAYVEGFNLWSVTLTTHQIFSAEKWREITMRFRQSVIYSDFAGVWRVELQRRKTPHLHVGFWLPQSATLADVESLWLKATGEGNDPAAQEHAVVGRKIEQNEAGWAVYMAMHDGKHKEAQLGWKGKQWGVWNRSAFSYRDPESEVLNEREHAIFLSLLAEHDREKKLIEVCKKFAKDYGQETADYLANNLQMPLREIHAGNLLWCIDGEKVREMIARAKLLASQPS